jgi:hypothetical protein
MYIHIIKLKRMKIIITIQELSIVCLALFTLCILGAEPGTSESSMYEYEHAFDTGHVGWYLGWGWVVCLWLLIMSTKLIVIDNKRNGAK